MKKWLLGLMCVGMWTATAMGQATLPTSHSGSWTNAFLPTGWTAVGLGADYSAASGGYDGVDGGAARMDGANDAITISFSSAPGDVTYWARLNVGSGAWTTNIFLLQESTDGGVWSDVAVYNEANPIPTTAPTGPYTSTPSATARYLRFIYAQKGNGNVGIDGVMIASGSGMIATNVKFFASGAAVDEDQGTYEVTVYKTLAEGDVSGTIILSGTATEGAGADYTVDTTDFAMNGATTSATVTVTINDDAAEEAAETIIMTLDNVVGAGTTPPNVFTLTINPSDMTMYGITITTPVNGTVTTTPADEASEGATVTITATPNGGFAVDAITVVDEAMNPVEVNGDTFTMPATAVTVTVTFKVYEAPDFALDFSDLPSIAYSNTSTTANGLALDVSQCYRDVNAPDYMMRMRWISTNAGYFGNAVGFTNGSISKMAFQYKAYGASHTNYQFVVQFKTEGGEWTQVGDTYLASNTDWASAEVLAVPPGATYFRIQSVTPESGTVIKTGNFDNFGFWFGESVFSVTVDRTNGFVVLEGAGAAITATAANGTEDYAYGWTSDLDSLHFTAADNVFTILATAPVGDYSATVTATDASDPAQMASNTVNFSVVAPHAITITPPENGTVTTTPADEAIAGATVTITATPADGYAVDTYSVVGDDSTPIGTSATFVMPAQAVTVTVTFKVSVVPDAFITFENGTLPSSYTNNTALLEDGKVWSTMRIYKGNAENDKKIGAISARLYPVTGTNAVLQQTEAYAEAITRMSFSVASFSSDNMANVVLTAEVSANGTDWEVVKTLTGAAEITSDLTEHVIETIPANAVYARFVATAAAASGKHINIDNVGFDFGAATPTLDYTGATTGTVGEQMQLVFTVNGGTASGWEYTLESAAREELDTGNSNTFTWTPTSAGTYYLTMTALDEAVNPIATREVTLTVNPAGRPPIAGIVIVAGGGGDFQFDVPAGYALVRVEGASPTQLSGNTWTTLTQGEGNDFTVSGSTIRIRTQGQAGRMVRIWVQ